jgi:hypothetical protein
MGCATDLPATSGTTTLLKAIITYQSIWTTHGGGASHSKESSSPTSPIQ